MNIVEKIKSKLIAIDPPVFRIVAGAAEFASIQSVPKALPAAYVMTLHDASSDNERMTGPVLQQTSVDIGIVIVTGNLSDARGDASSHDIEALKKSVRDHLVGYVPDPEGDGMPLIHVSGELLKAWGGSIWWQEVLGASSSIEEQAAATAQP